MDLTNLNVVVNEVYTGDDQVPESVRPCVVNPQYLLIVSTLALLTGHMPHGDFYNLLRRADAGAGRADRGCGLVPLSCHCASLTNRASNCFAMASHEYSGFCAAVNAS